MITDCIQNKGSKKVLTEPLNVFLAIITAVVITVSLQLSVVTFSKLGNKEEIKPELVVGWLMQAQKKTEINNRKPVSKQPVAPVKKNIIKKPLEKKVNKPVPYKKKTYSPLATKVDRKKVEKQIEPENEKITNNEAIENSQDVPIPAPVFKLTEVPRFLHKEPLVYPEAMRSLGNAGIVELSVLIDKYGTVRKVTIVDSGGVEFDKQAKIALLASTFIAAKIKDKPVAAILKLSVKFNLI